LIQVTGHRGAAGLEPENTLRSVRRALDLGVDQVEVDVHLTRDGRLVVIHDETVDRTTDGQGRVGGLTFEEVRRLDAGKEERVPTLQEVLGLTLGRVVLHVELKGPGTAGPVVRAVERNKAERWVVITSFRHEMLEEVRRLNPSLGTGAIFSKPKNDPCQEAIDVGARSVLMNYRHVDADLVRRAHERGLKIEAWNPDTEEEMRRMIDLGVDAICTNRPDILLQVLGRETGA